MKRYLSFTIWLFILVLLTLSIVTPAHAVAAWYVAPSGDDANSCDDPAAACASINGALAKAAAGDTIYVAEGTYSGSGEQVVTIDKDIILSGGWDSTFSAQPGYSTLDGERLRRGILVADVTVTIERFTVIQGLNISTSNNGGGVYNGGTLTLRDCEISDNHAYSGGGIFNAKELTLENCRVHHNTAIIFGGGVHNDQDRTLTIKNSMIHENNATSGAGISDYGALRVDASSVVGNQAKNNGGGIYVNYTVNPAIITNSTISENSSMFGGGLGMDYGSCGSCVAQLSNVTVVGNTATTQGGGIHAAGTVTLKHTLLANNHATSSGPDCQYTLASAGYNLIGSTSGCNIALQPGDLADLDAKVGGTIGMPGAPFYAPLLTGSPAINGGDPTGCMDQQGNPLTTDIRGVARTGNCDIGVYEYTVPGPASMLSAVWGTPQRTPTGKAFPRPIKAAALDSIGSPVEGVSVTFTAPASGPSAVFTSTNNNITTINTDAGGVALAGVRRLIIGISKSQWGMNVLSG